MIVDTSIAISGTGLYTPPETISNAELVTAFNTYVQQFNAANKDRIESGEILPLRESSSTFIEKASGIKNRYVMEKSGILDPARMCPRIAERPDNELSLQAEISITAIRNALKRARKTPADIDAVIVSCSATQRAYPAVAIEIQSALGIHGYAFDMNGACTAATFAIKTAMDAIGMGTAGCVVVVNPDIVSGQVNWRDRDSHFIFGDACTAVVLERTDTVRAPHAWEILGSRLFTRFSNNVRNNFGFLNRADGDGIGKPDKLFYQNGPKVFREVIPLAKDLIVSHARSLDILPERIRRLWLHQANINLNRIIVTGVLGHAPSQDCAPNVLSEYGNTMAAGVIIAFHKYHRDLLPGDIGVICSFGAGYAVGSLVVRRLTPPAT